MPYRVAADLTMTLHFAFTAFVTVGALLLIWRPWIAWIHLPAVAYGVAIEVVGWTCPLTPLEQHFRALAGQAGYRGGFLEHYLGRILYPAGWESLHLWFGMGLIALNLMLYGSLLARRRARKGAGAGRPDPSASDPVRS